MPARNRIMVPKSASVILRLRAGGWKLRATHAPAMAIVNRMGTKNLPSPSLPWPVIQSGRGSSSNPPPSANPASIWSRVSV